MKVAYVGACLGAILVVVVAGSNYDVIPITVFIWGLIYIAEGAIAGGFSGIRQVPIYTAFSGAFVGLLIAGIFYDNLSSG